MGSWSNGTTSPRHGDNQGSTPCDSTITAACLERFQSPAAATTAGLLEIDPVWPHKPSRGVQFPHPLPPGPVVQRQGIRLARGRRRFESGQVHQQGAPRTSGGTEHAGRMRTVSRQGLAVSVPSPPALGGQPLLIVQRPGRLPVEQKMRVRFPLGGQIMHADSSRGGRCAANAEPGGSTPPCMSRFRTPRGAAGQGAHQGARGGRRGEGPDHQTRCKHPTCRKRREPRKKHFWQLCVHFEHDAPRGLPTMPFPHSRK
jgi:hypothetical protein